DSGAAAASRAASGDAGPVKLFDFSGERPCCRSVSVVCHCALPSESLGGCGRLGASRWRRGDERRERHETKRLEAGLERLPQLQRPAVLPPTAGPRGNRRQGRGCLAARVCRRRDKGQPNGNAAFHLS
ncbi:putative helicase, partial [Toxoplasma gondii ARI]